jgi:uncharacterized protein YprB with RNaseH-like and TPR domain
MSDLIDKLKSLGVNIGSGALTSSTVEQQKPDLVQELAGAFVQNNFGTAFIIDKQYPYGSLANLELPEMHNNLQYLADWCGEPSILEDEPGEFVFLDTETTSLSGGTGTFTFLIGAGKFEKNHFRVSQFFLQDPIDEPSQLYALEEFISGSRTVITYNGKSFDIPLLNTRFLAHGWRAIFSDYVHIDLLHLARRLWSERLNSRTLSSIEINVLNVQRTKEDIPGWMIPNIYHNYLRFGEIDQLKNVLYHNLMDVLSLSILFNHAIKLTRDPQHHVEYDEDFLSLAKFYENIGNIREAIKLYRCCIGVDLPTNQKIMALEHLAFIYKRRNQYKLALPLWKTAAQANSTNACIEIAKYHEHRNFDYEKALYWTNTAIKILKGKKITRYEKNRLLSELKYRKNRLIRLLTNSGK